MPITEPIDEDELEAELATLEQEKLDEDMLKTGTMPITSPLNGLPNGPTGDSKFFFFFGFKHTTSPPPPFFINPSTISFHFFTIRIQLNPLLQ